MVEIGREKVWNDSIRNVSNVQGSIGDEGLTGLYDTILAFNLLHLVPDLEATLGQVRSQLPKGGLFISKTPCLKSWSWFLRPVLTVLRAVGKAPPVSLLNPDRLVQRIASAGFEIVETGDYPRKPPARFVVARKL